jgi:hypothetical protein
MIVTVTEVEYTESGATECLPSQFELEIADELCENDDTLSNEVVRLIKEQVGHDVVGCAIDL